MLSVPLTKKSITFISAPVPYLQLSYLDDDAENYSVNLSVSTRQWNKRFEYSDFWAPEFSSFLVFDLYKIPAKNTIPISLEFLNFNRVGLISYFLHGDLNNTLSIGHSSRNN